MDYSQGKNNRLDVGTGMAAMRPEHALQTAAQVNALSTYQD
jgi:hypothetical protein